MGRRIVTAIDVGSSKITTVIAVIEDEKQRPQVIGVCTQPSNGIKRGIVVNIEEATNSIIESVTAAERMAGVTVSDVYATINGEQITSINNKGVVAVSGPEITLEDTYRAIENAKTLAIPQNIGPIHIIPREFVVDSQRGIKYPLGMSGTRLEVETHIITAPSSALQNLCKCIETLGFTVNDLVSVGWASSLAVLTETEKELGVALLDMGAGTTSITVFQDGAICYSGCIALGGLSVTSDIAIGLQLTIEDAEKVKVNIDKIFAERNTARENNPKTPALLVKKASEEGGKEKKKSGDLVDVSFLGIQSKKEISKLMLKQIIEARLEEIFDMAKETVARAGYDLAMPAGVVLTGGSSLLKDMTKVAQSSFGVTARVAYPSGLTGMTEEISSPAYSAVQGLIKHAVDDTEDFTSQGKSGGKLGAGIGGLFGKVRNWIKSILP